MKRLIGSLCATLMVMGLSACGMEAPVEPEQASQAQAADSGEHLQSERGGIGLEPHDRTLSASATTIDARKSLAVTERTLLASFPIQDVFNQLAAQGGGFTGVQLFRQLWDTQNPSPGQADLHAVANYNHCTANGNTLNGFPYGCREIEGAQAASSTSINHYDAVGLYNRFDLAPANGANCGEYRIVFAKRASTPGGGRNFIIFEAVLPNPDPVAGIEGCRPVANFWRDLRCGRQLDRARRQAARLLLRGPAGLHARDPHRQLWQPRQRTGPGAHQPVHARSRGCCASSSCSAPPARLPRASCRPR